MTIRNVFLIAAAMTSSFALAQETKTMAPVRVEADEPDDRSEGSESYTVDRSTTAFKLPLSLRETPQTVTVIPSEVIDDFNLKTTRDILGFTPGVHVQQERNTEAYYFEARGFEMQTQWDGVPSPNGFGGRGQNSPDAAMIDRVEVLHGANGLLSGPGSPGGTVNLWHKTPGDEFASSFQASVDSFGGYRVVGDVGGPFGSSAFGGRLVAVHEERALYIDDASGKHNVFYGVLEAQAGDNTKFQLGGSYERTYDANFAQHFGIPSRPDGSLYNIPRDLNMGASWAHEETELVGSFLRVDHSFANDWTLTGMVTYETTQHDALEGVPNSEGTPQLLVWPQIEGWDNQSTAMDLFLQGPVEWFGRSHQLMFGFNGAKRREKQDDYQFASEPVGEIDTENPTSWHPSDAAPWDSVEYGSMNWGNGDRKQYGPFAAGRFELSDSVHAIVGARVTEAEQVYTDSDPVKEESKLTPYAGLTWDFSEHWSTYLSYSDIFRLQDSYTRDLDGNQLEPVVGKNYEIGFKGEWLDGALNGSLAIFRLDQTKLAEEDFDHPDICGGDLQPCYKATGLVRSEGFDVSLAGELGRGWQIIGGYSFLQATHQTGEDAGQPYDTQTPKHQLNVALSYASENDRWRVGGNVRFQSQVYTEGSMWWALDEDGEWDDEIAYRIQQDNYATFGLFGSFKVTDHLELDLAAENLGDQVYLSGISWPAHGQVYGEPRQFTLTLTGTF